MSKYEIVIGIETHVQLATKSKLFCGCNNDSREADPNTNVCPVCLGFPGALPVLNGAAVQLALKAGHVLHTYENGTEFHSKFDRKNYFYPDSPMNYQITQFDEPIIGNGYVEVPIGGGVKRVGVTRAHLEADAGKLVHPPGADYSLVDLNRAGTPLIEIVSEPDMRSAEEAKAYTQELYHLMRFAEVSDANLYYGNMRFDVNVSLREVGSSEFGTRTESKNLNSFRAVQGVVEFETKRQAELLDKGAKVVQETRGWDEGKQETFSQRSKEEAHDYRYFPEPDLPPLVVSKAMLSKAKELLPSHMPAAIRKALGDAVPSKSIEILLGEPRMAQQIVEIEAKLPNAAIQVVKWIVGLDQVQQDMLNNRLKKSSAHDLLSSLVKTVEMVEAGKLSSTNAKVVVEELLRGASDPEEVVRNRELIQVSDRGALEKIVDDVIAAHPKPVEDFMNGEAKALGFLVGQVMKASKGQANPPMVNAILKEKLGSK